MSDDEELMTVDQLCAQLKIGRNRAYILLHIGEIKAFRIGRVWKIPKNSVNEYLAKVSNDK